MAQGDIGARHMLSRERLSTIAILTAVVALAFILRALAFWWRGVLDYDETYYYILGTNLLSGRGYTLNGLPHTAFPPLYPALVGFAAFFTASIRTATSSVSLLAGAALPVPVYLLAKDLCGRRAGFAAAAAAAAWPALFFFAARSVPYGERMYGGSEPLFVTLAATGVLLAWLAARRDSRAFAAAGGAALGLAALARDEGLAFFGAVLAWFVFDRLFFSRAGRSRRAVQVALLAAAFLVALAPFLVHVRMAGGRWSAGSKVSNFAVVRPAIWKWIRYNDAADYVAAHYALNDDATEMADEYWGVSQWHRSRARAGGLESALAMLSRPDWRWVDFFRRIATGGRLPLVQWYLWPFLGIGAASMLAGDVGRRYLLLAALLLAQHVAVGAATYVIARFELPLLPLAAVPLGAGLAIAGAALGRALRLPKLARLLPRAAGSLALAVPAVAIVALLARDGVRVNREGAVRRQVRGAVSSSHADRRLAETLKAYVPPGASLMCNRPWVAVWAGADWRVSPQAKPEAIVAYARSRGIDYAILGSWQVPGFTPQGPLGAWLAATIEQEGRHYLFDFTGGAAVRGDGAGHASPQEGSDA